MIACLSSGGRSGKVFKVVNILKSENQ